MEEDLVSHMWLFMLGRDSQIDSPLVCSEGRRKEDGNYTKWFYWHMCWWLQCCRCGGNFPLFSILSAAIAASQLASLMSHVTQPFKKEQEHNNLNSSYIPRSQILVAHWKLLKLLTPGLKSFYKQRSYRYIQKHFHLQLLVSEMNSLVNRSHSFSFEIKRHMTSLNWKALSFSLIIQMLTKDLDCSLNSNHTDQQQKAEVPECTDRPDFSCSWQMVWYWKHVLK